MRLVATVTAQLLNSLDAKDEGPTVAVPALEVSLIARVTGAAFNLVGPPATRPQAGGCRRGLHAVSRRGRRRFAAGEAVAPLGRRRVGKRPGGCRRPLRSRARGGLVCACRPRNGGPRLSGSPPHAHRARLTIEVGWDPPTIRPSVVSKTTLTPSSCTYASRKSAVNAAHQEPTECSGAASGRQQRGGRTNGLDPFALMTLV